MAARILLVEDDTAIADAVAYSLRASGYDVDAVASGEVALRSGPESYDLLMLDLMLPGLSGVEVCRRVREHSGVPILMLTALTSETDRVIGLEAGADDYVSKPFSMSELISRVRAILRRRDLDRAEDHGPIRQAGDLRLHLQEQTAWRNGAPVDLTPTEFRLLAMLTAEPERVFTRQEISRRLTRSTTWAGDERACDAHIKNLRRKIEDDPAQPRCLLTVRGVGYLFRAPLPG